MTNNQDFISKLAEGYSTQAKTTNKFWLVLMITSIIALVGRIDNEKLIELPFTLGKVESSDFYTITIILIAVVSIVFTAAMTQAMRSRMLIQRAIDAIPDKEMYILGVHMQDYFDSIASPTYIRVAPISQFMLGKNQFFGAGKQKKATRRLASVFYIILKITTFVFLYLVPYFAIKKCWINRNLGIEKQTLHIPVILLSILTVIAAICMLILLIGDIINILKVSRRLLK